VAIKIVTDSSCDLPRELVAQYGITVVPLRMWWDNETYLDGVDFTAREFFARLSASDTLPKTSQPSIGDFVEAYRGLVRAGHSVISIHVSSMLSGTYNCAHMAKEMVGGDIQVVDSEHISLGMGFQVLEAARAAVLESKAEVLRVISSARRSMRMVCCLPTLEYLRKSGRIGDLAAFIGTLLSIKPLIAVEKGRLVSTERARGFRHAISRMVDSVTTGLPKGARHVVGVMHAATRETADWLQDEMKRRLQPVEVLVIETGPAIGTYSGPGGVGIAVYQRWRGFHG